MHGVSGGSDFGGSTDEDRSGISQAHNRGGNRRHCRYEHGSESGETDSHQEAKSDSPFPSLTLVEISRVRFAVIIALDC